ncbi:MAG: M14-type cytosolic carboxypeptidase [Gammaproteobacteria bacterium]|nr:M14-type cytosolic carboxypeptidase [Gammaproteobacteria bacterium]
MQHLRIDSHFDGGNIEVLAADDPADIRLRIKADAKAGFLQWFNFEVLAPRGTHLKLIFENAADISFKGGWKNYRAVASDDGEIWLRTATSFEAKLLTIEHTTTAELTRFAYFAPYSLDRHHNLVAKLCTDERVKMLPTGTTPDGRALHVLAAGKSDAPRHCWIIARQHPGETMAEWFMEGLTEALLDPANPVARKLLDRARLYLVPNMNPDGSARGHLRANAVGTNLNREWNAPDAERSPEVAHVRALMEESGVDFFLDIHGDEIMPYLFIAGAEGAEAYDDRHRDLAVRFKQLMLEATPEFQTQYGYPVTPAGKANLGIATNWVANTFDCLAYTLEMPFKDNLTLPDAVRGWSPERSKKLGADILGPLLGMLDHLR